MKNAPVKNNTNDECISNNICVEKKEEILLIGDNVTGYKMVGPIKIPLNLKIEKKVVKDVVVKDVVMFSKEFYIDKLSDEQKNHKNFPRYVKFLNDATNKHGNAFNYSKIDPIVLNNIKKSIVIVICNDCGEEKETNIKNHLRIISECKKCLSNKENLSIISFCKVGWPITYGEFVKMAISLHGTNYNYSKNNLITEVNASSKVYLICNICKFELKCEARYHLEKKRNCGNCKKWNYDKFVSRLTENHKNNYFYESEDELKNIIINKNSIIRVRCKHCSYEFYPSVHEHILSYSKCLVCTNNEPWKHNMEKLLRLSKEKYGDKFNYELVKPEFLETKESKIPVICKCGYFFLTSIVNHVVSTSNKIGCKSCSKQLPWTYERFIIKADLIHKGKYDYSLTKPEDVTNLKSQLSILCNCGHKFTQLLNNHINQRQGCPVCGGHLPHTLEIFKRKFIDVYGEPSILFNIDRVEECHIKNVDSHVPIRCLTCNKSWTPTIRSFLNDRTGCPSCHASKGERACRNYFSSNGIPFEEQVELNTVSRKRFDFLIKYDNKNYYVEFDGKQHFRYVEFFNKTFDKFIQRQEYDILKTKAVLETGHNIIRIDYTQLKNVGLHISKALELNQRTYFSNEELYLYITEEL